jgi:hypothetical protein
MVCCCELRLLQDITATRVKDGEYGVVVKHIIVGGRFESSRQIEDTIDGSLSKLKMQASASTKNCAKEELRSPDATPPSRSL